CVTLIPAGFCDNKLAFFLDSCFLKAIDEEFVQLVTADVDFWLRNVKNRPRVLVFPPVSSYHRLLIHNIAQTFTELCTFSIGQGPERRTVVCLQELALAWATSEGATEMMDKIKAGTSSNPASSKKLGKLATSADTMTAARRMDSAGRPPRTASSSVKPSTLPSSRKPPRELSDVCRRNPLPTSSSGSSRRSSADSALSDGNSRPGKSLPERKPASRGKLPDRASGHILEGKPASRKERPASSDSTSSPTDGEGGRITSGSVTPASKTVATSQQEQKRRRMEASILASERPLSAPSSRRRTVEGGQPACTRLASAALGSIRPFSAGGSRLVGKNQPVAGTTTSQSSRKATGETREGEAARGKMKKPSQQIYVPRAQRVIEQQQSDSHKEVAKGSITEKPASSSSSTSSTGDKDRSDKIITKVAPSSRKSLTNRSSGSTSTSVDARSIRDKPAGHASSSRMTGTVRKVPLSPNLKQVKPETAISSRQASILPSAKGVASTRSKARTGNTEKAQLRRPPKPAPQSVAMFSEDSDADLDSESCDEDFMFVPGNRFIDQSEVEMEVSSNNQQCDLMSGGDGLSCNVANTPEIAHGSSQAIDTQEQVLEVTTRCRSQEDLVYEAQTCPELSMALDCEPDTWSRTVHSQPLETLLSSSGADRDIGQPNSASESSLDNKSSPVAEVVAAESSNEVVDEKQSDLSQVDSVAVATDEPAASVIDSHAGCHVNETGVSNLITVEDVINPPASLKCLPQPERDQMPEECSLLPLETTLQQDAVSDSVESATTKVTAAEELITPEQLEPDEQLITTTEVCEQPEVSDPVVNLSPDSPVVRSPLGSEGLTFTQQRERETPGSTFGDADDAMDIASDANSQGASELLTEYTQNVTARLEQSSPNTIVSVNVLHTTVMSTDEVCESSDSISHTTSGECLLQPASTPDSAVLLDHASCGEDNKEKQHSPEPENMSEILGNCQPDTVEAEDNAPPSVQQVDTQDAGEFEEDSWEAHFDENGECLNPELMNELTIAVGTVAIDSPQFDYYNWKPREPVFDEGEYGHIVEISGFPSEFRAEDLISVFSAFRNKGFDIKWVDDTHALGVFSSPIAAAEALQMQHPLVQTKPLSEASKEARAKAKRSQEFIQPYKARPETSASVARRMVTGALGLRPNISREQREHERQKLREAKDKKKLDDKQRKDAWEGL
ncbi:PREDICTED: coiled-coil domain-containing protein R3HCC1L-like, partial [Priapulus caudatus]|uniref:Coiled-coil domain-containing protein R3HCC1L-like n=1 Tax=Priapulus caudatus TaxID=37621 RepID=A0ABM1DZ06_PRICU